MTNEIATQAGHWYAADGSPMYTIKGANGQERNTTLRDARKLNLLPSVTEILKCAAKPALEAWKQNQVMLAAMTLPKIEGEGDEAFCKRVLEDSREQGRKAAERGSNLHGAIECHLLGKPYASEWIPHVDAVIQALIETGVNVLTGEPERSFGSAKGYGGKCDWHSKDQRVVLDFKSKPCINDKVAAYDDQLIQLCAYQDGLQVPGARLLNVFVGIDDAKVKIHEWPVMEHARGWRMFAALLDYWQASKNYTPTA